MIVVPGVNDRAAVGHVLVVGHRLAEVDDCGKRLLTMVDTRLQRGHVTLSPWRATGCPSIVHVGSPEMTTPPCDVRSPSTMNPMIATPSSHFVYQDGIAYQNPSFSIRYETASGVKTVTGVTILNNRSRNCFIESSPKHEF
jgi:hypothetical protein